MRTERLALPESLRWQMLRFRQHLWRVKMVEAAAGAVIGIAAAFLVSYALDRFVDTPAWLRGLLLATAAAGCALVPFAWHRWVYRRRHLEQLARPRTRVLHARRTGELVAAQLQRGHAERPVR